MSKKFTIFICMILAANLTFAQWIQQNPYPGNSEIRFSDIFFHDQNHGWVVGGEENDNRCFLTTDGGYSWEWMLVWGGGMATGVHFSDENNGWICSEGDNPWEYPMSHSSNGGVGLEGWLPQDIEISPSHDLASVFLLIR